MIPALLTEAQAATHLAVCQRTLRKARQQGRLRFVLIGRAIRYTLPDLDQFIEASSQQECISSPDPAPRSRAAARTGPGGAVIVPFSQRR